MTNTDEARISCQIGNLKTTLSMSVYFLSLFQSKRGEFSLLQTGSSLFFVFFSETYDSTFEFWINPKKYWNWNQTHWWAFSPCIRTTIKYTVSISQGTCFIETFSSRGLFPYLVTDHYFSGRGLWQIFVWKHFYKHIQLRKHSFSNIIFVVLVFFFICAQYYNCPIKLWNKY